MGICSGGSPPDWESVALIFVLHLNPGKLISVALWKRGLSFDFPGLVLREEQEYNLSKFT